MSLAKFYVGKFALAGLALAIALLPASCLSQDEAKPNPKLPLPSHALWRFGGIEDIGANGYYLLAFSPDGKYLAARNRENVVEVRNVRTRKLVCEIGGHEARIQALDFSPDSRFLLTKAGSNEGVKIWDIHSGRLQQEIDCKPTMATFSDRGHSILVLERQTLLEYSWPEGKLVDAKKMPENLDSRLVVSGNGRFVIASQRINNRRIFLTKLVDLKNDSSVIMDGPPELPKRVVISQDDNWVAATYPRKDSIRLWNLQNPSELNYELKGHSQTVESIAFSPDNRFLVSTGWDKNVVVWDLLTREKIGELKGHAEHVNCCAFAPLSLALATGASGLNDCTVIVWSLENFLFPAAAKQIEPDQFAAAWTAMGNSNPAKAFSSLNDLRNSTDRVFELVKQKVAQPLSTSRDQISRWIKDLDSSEYKIRDKATQELIAVRGPAERLLIEELRAARSTEMRYRLSLVLRQSVARPKINVAELRRIHRSIFLLELISQQPSHRSDAIEVLESISQNHPHFDVSRDATSALERINVRQTRLDEQ